MLKPSTTPRTSLTPRSGSVQPILSVLVNREGDRLKSGLSRAAIWMRTGNRALQFEVVPRGPDDWYGSAGGGLRGGSAAQPDRNLRATGRSVGAGVKRTCRPAESASLLVVLVPAFDETKPGWEFWGDEITLDKNTIAMPQERDLTGIWLETGALWAYPSVERG
jgi:hypothetical protein